MPEYLDRILNALIQHKFACLLIGGQALTAYGYARQTLDIDLLIDETKRESLQNILRAQGFQLTAETPNSLRFTHAELKILEIDVMLVDPPTYENLYSNSSTITTEHAQFRVPAPQHFIALKLHAIKNNPARELKDLADIVEVIRRLHDKIDTDDVKKICEQFGPPGVYSKISGHLK